MSSFSSDLKTETINNLGMMLSVPNENFIEIQPDTWKNIPICLVSTTKAMLEEVN
jgi:hypothetical protein